MIRQIRRHLLSGFVTLGLAAGLTVGLASAPAVAASTSAAGAVTAPATARGECQPEDDEAMYRSAQVDRKKKQLAKARREVRAAQQALDEATTPRERRIARERLDVAQSEKAQAKQALKRARAREAAAYDALDACLGR